eukprot:TRINITY_DN2163_c0_g1_i1.p1 TRINITY_DN2163_c0_g1~~TRINITY_DN2163_c0_g1_i1.p1  ORF type:complete len:319 (+),score=76.33 TRINITY_DN2163_c0_g1_i1:64-1020(+)
MEDDIEKNEWSRLPDSSMINTVIPGPLAFPSLIDSLGEDEASGCACCATRTRRPPSRPQATTSSSPSHDHSHSHNHLHSVSQLGGPTSSLPPSDTPDVLASFDLTQVRAQGQSLAMWHRSIIQQALVNAAQRPPADDSEEDEDDDNAEEEDGEEETTAVLVAPVASVRESVTWQGKSIPAQYQLLILNVSAEEEFVAFCPFSLVAAAAYSTTDAVENWVSKMESKFKLLDLFMPPVSRCNTQRLVYTALLSATQRLWIVQHASVFFLLDHQLVVSRHASLQQAMESCQLQFEEMCVTCSELMVFDERSGTYVVESRMD